MDKKGQNFLFFQMILAFFFFINTNNATAVSVDLTQPININGYPVNIPEILDQNSSLWELLQEFSRPDSDFDTCQTTTIAFVSANEAEMQRLFPWFWDAQDDLDEGADIFCSILQSIPNLTYDEMIAAQLFENGSSTLNIFDVGTVPDWHNVNGLVLDHPLGTIEFTGTIDLLSHDFVFLLISFAEAFSMDQAYVSLDSDIITGLKNIGAIITMKNVPEFELPVILVDGVVNEDIISAFVYDKEARTITFNTAHFTSFQAVEFSSISTKEDDTDDENDNKRPKIYSAKIERLTYANGHDYYKITANGKNFEKGFDMYFGGRKSVKDVRVNSKKAIGYFKKTDFINAFQDMYKLKIYNSSSRKRTFDEELSITNIPHQYMN